jgi:hypothetical protein
MAEGIRHGFCSEVVAQRALCMGMALWRQTKIESFERLSPLYELKVNLRANHPSSSSLLVGAGRGAPGFSLVGSLT